MWTRVSSTDTAGLQRHVAVMQQMDRGYGKLTPRDLVRAIIEQRGELWRYEGGGFEIGMLFQYAWDRSQWQLAQVGFFGNATPAEVLELNVAQGKAVFRAQGIDVVFCGVPHQMDHQPLVEYYSLCKQHPQLRVDVVHEAETKDIWEIRFGAP